MVKIKSTMTFTLWSCMISKTWGISYCQDHLEKQFLQHLIYEFSKFEEERYVMM